MLLYAFFRLSHISVLLYCSTLKKNRDETVHYDALKNFQRECAEWQEKFNIIAPNIKITCILDTTEHSFLIRVEDNSVESNSLLKLGIKETTVVTTVIATQN